MVYLIYCKHTQKALGKWRREAASDQLFTRKLFDKI